MQLPVLVSASGALLLAMSATAQSVRQDTDVVNEVVVTARLREEPARDVPFALTSFDARALAAADRRHT